MFGDHGVHGHSHRADWLRPERVNINAQQIEIAPALSTYEFTTDFVMERRRLLHQRHRSALPCQLNRGGRASWAAPDYENTASYLRR